MTLHHRKHMVVLVAFSVLFCGRGAFGQDAKSRTEGTKSGQSGSVETHEMTNAVLWEQTSGEYIAVCQQTYLTARRQLTDGLSDPHWTAHVGQDAASELPPAIMLDLDETVFVNGCYEARIIKEYGQYTPDTFAAWCNEAKCEAVPGCIEFLKFAEKLGVEIFYLSGRTVDLTEGTMKNLKRIGAPIDEKGSHLLLNDGTSTEERRAKIAANHRVLLLLGDNLDDFVEGSKATPEERVALAKKNASMFGRKWIILPNPMYGHWEASIYGFDYAKPRSEILKLKDSALKDCRTKK